jgi:Ca2+-binding RTX toxin-like protein
MEENERRYLFAGAVAASLSDIPVLHSRPSASAKLFLDFNGDPARSWLSFSVPTTPAFDTDGDTRTFSAAEQSDMQEIWARVSEKYSPFNLDVTTVDPGNRRVKVTMQIVVGGDGQWLSDQGGGEAGGVAPLGGFATGPDTGYVFSGAFFDNKSIAEAVAHEAGHGFGLEHQSTFKPDGTIDQQYNPGNLDVAPIMGVSYYSTRGLWFRDKNSDNRTQDDLFILSNSTNGFGYRPDDWSNTFLSATQLPRTDNVASVSGVIEKTSDVDAFRFSTAAGPVTFDVAPALGGMLDATLTITDVVGNVLAQTNTASLGESISVDLPEGEYAVSISSAGNYGDIGQYTLTGNLPAGTIGGGPGPLLVLGTEFADVITITLSGYTYSIDVNDTITTHDVDGVNGFNIYSADGPDRITLGPGVIASYIDSGPGNDTVFAGEFNDSITGGAGNDLIYCGGGDDRVNGGNHSDYILGQDGRDRLYGNSGNDVLEGGPGGDRLYGGDGHDILAGGSNSDKMFGEEGNDTMYGGRGTDYMNGGIGLDVLYGQEGDDMLYTADDFTYDYLDGGVGTDHAQSGDTTDILTSVEDLFA